MAWVRLDDQAPRNNKMLKAGPAACWLWVCGIAHSQSQLTDGFISLEALPMIGVAGMTRCRKLADELVKIGLFDKAEDGYVVHDYLDHNPSKASVMMRRAEDSERKRLVESNRIPRGIQPDSGAPRARVPSHPIPSHPQAPPADAQNGDALTERAGRLREELYPAWYAKFRHGARLRIVANSLEFQDALSLVKTWDDERLAKLAQIVLTTDEDWIAKTDRGFKIFATKASWADDRLREVESETT